jgi:hypothetical protein
MISVRISRPGPCWPGTIKLKLASRPRSDQCSPRPVATEGCRIATGSDAGNVSSSPHSSARSRLRRCSSSIRLRLERGEPEASGCGPAFILEFRAARACFAPNSRTAISAIRAFRRSPGSPPAGSTPNAPLPRNAARHPAICARMPENPGGSESPAKYRIPATHKIAAAMGDPAGDTEYAQWSIRTRQVGDDSFRRSSVVLHYAPT